MRGRILLNGLFLDYPTNGTWTYTRNLPPALAVLDPTTRYTLAVRRVRGSTFDAVGSGRRLDVSNLALDRPAWPIRSRGSGWAERLDKLGWEQVALSLAARRCDLVHSLYFAAPAILPAPLIVTVHDVLPLRAGYAHSSWARLYARLMRSTVRRSSAIIAVSEYARSEIAEAFGYPIERIHVTYEAPDPSLGKVSDPFRLAAVRDEYRLPERYVLYLGGTERRKNLRVLVEAWNRRRPADCALVIVGRFREASDALFPDIPGLVVRLGLGPSVHFIPSVSPPHLAAVYSLALAFCYPSTYEGFGLPPLEAMICGTPVLSSKGTSLGEVLNGGAELLEPEDAEAWSHAMVRVVEDQTWSRELRERGSRKVADYSWERTALATLRVYDAVLGGP